MDSRRSAGDDGAMSCSGCSRRELLHGLAVTTVAVVAGCSGDGVPVQPDGMNNPAITMCGTNLCIDLTAAANAALTAVEGAMTVLAPHDKIIVVCTATGSYTANSDICTHAGCSVGYDRSNKILACPCHNSKFALSGAVQRGPATRALKHYETMFDASTQVLTIVLA